MDAVELAIKMTADVGDVEAAFDGAGASAARMGENVEAATKGADKSVARMDKVGDAADGMASGSAQAAGGLGDLGGALSLMPGPLGKLGAGMEAAAPAIMGVTGASDLLNLATKSTIVTQTRARVATIASTVASRTAAVATRAMTAGQWLLNAALSANPIGLVVAAVALLIAGIVLAYNKSETFRRIVDAAMRGAREAVGFVLDKLGDLIALVGGKAGAVWDSMKQAATNAVNAIMSPIRTAIDLVERLIGFISNIDFPDAPDWLKDAAGGFGNPFNNGRVIAVGRQVSPDAAALGATTIDARTYIEVDASGLVDTGTLVQLLADLLRRQGVRLGEVVPGARVVTT